MAKKQKGQPPFRIRDGEENLHELVENLEVLRIGIDAFQAKKSAWRIVSARLHLLLTDRSHGKKPLGLRIIPDLRLHPLRQDFAHEVGRTLMAAPGFCFTPDGLAVAVMFDYERLKIPLDDWLAQVIYIQHYQGRGYPITLEALVREPRHQAGGVHFDEQLRQEMALIEGMFSFIRHGESVLTYRELLVTIGEYIHSEITNQLMLGLAYGYAADGKTEKAEEFLNNALTICRDKGNLEGTSHVLHALGYLNNNYLQAYDRAAALYLESLEISERIGDTENELRVKRNLIVAFINLGNRAYHEVHGYSQAIDAYKKALGFARAADERVDELVILANLGSVYSSLGDAEEAVAVGIVGRGLAIDALVVAGEEEMALRRVYTRLTRNLLTIKREESDFEVLLGNVLNDLAAIAVRATGQEYSVVIDGVKETHEGIVQFLSDADDWAKGIAN